jgi:hypothetical protein
VSWALKGNVAICRTPWEEAVCIVESEECHEDRDTAWT